MEPADPDMLIASSSLSLAGICPAAQPITAD
jgi:hypothetical protein